MMPPDTCPPGSSPIPGRPAVRFNYWQYATPIHDIHEAPYPLVFSASPQKDLGPIADYTDAHCPAHPSLDGFYEPVMSFSPPILSPPSTVSASSLSSLSTSSCTRGPSPLRNSSASVSSGDSATFASASTVAPDEAGHFICLGPQCDASFATSRELEGHIKELHTHTCNWAGCAAGSFGTSEELVAHVKREHLLVCPVAECHEALGSRKLVGSHMAVKHPEKGPDAATGKRSAEDDGQGMRRSKQIRVGGEKKVGGLVEDKKLSEYLSVNVWKRRCGEKLKGVLEKRARRVGGGTPRTADSPASEPRSSLDSAPFPLVWEHGVLPFLIEFIPKWCGPGYVISVTRRPTSSFPSSSRAIPGRRINIMTRKPVSRARRMIIASHVRDLLPLSYRQSSSFCFSEGEVSRLVWARGLTRDLPDEVCPPRNPFHFKHPCMGDSIGISDSEETEEATATLGPCLIVGGGPFWLANLHPFIDAVLATEEAKMVQHPSPADRDRCKEKDHDALEGRLSDDFALGRLTAWSGFDLKTTRISHDPYWEEMDKEPPMVVTDWTLLSSSEKVANVCRRFPQEHNPLLKEPLVRTIGAISPGSVVTVSSRTSGYQRGVVCEIPAYLDGASNSNGTGIATREWFIEDFSSEEDDNEWIRSGVGVPGDSGAAIVDADTNTLIGQLWGRNNYWGRGQRIAFFTPISDVLDDVQERCRLSTRPTLPQYRDEADRYPVYPSCRQCYDLRAYLDSRRSSRESLVSMIGAPPRRGADSEHELTSTDGPSELATPKDQSYWLRQAVPEEGSSFASLNNLASPIPLSSFFGGAGNPGTPRITEGVRSPYATMLNDMDLYEDVELASPTEKRGVLIRSEGREEKRRKVE